MVRKKTKDKSQRSQKKQRIVLDNIEDAFHLVTFVDYELRNRKVGAYVLRKGDQYRFVFGFDTQGYHPTLDDQDLNFLFDRLESGLKDFPPGESMKIHYMDFCTIGEREKELEERWAKTDNELLQLIIKDKIARTRELVRDGRRREKRIVLYCSFTVDVVKATAHYNSAVERAMAWLYGIYESMVGSRRGEQERFERLAQMAFLDGYLRWENFLSTTLGLEVKAISAEGLWALVWRRFNRGEPIEIPQVVEVRKTGFKEVVRSMTHPLTLLVGEREPVADDLWVNVKGRYVGALTLVEKPAGWPDKRRQLQYIWDSLIAKERVFDVEIFAEITRANEGLVTESVRRLLRQSMSVRQLAADYGTIDVGAELRVKKAVQAQAQIMEGAVPFWLGFVVLVHRRTVEDLDEICRYIESCFLRPAWVERERFVTWQLWVQTFPIYWDRMLVRPTNRRLLFLHTEVIGLLPLVKHQQMDKRGLELITDQGYMPLFVDMVGSPEPFHLMLLAMTRNGKSVLANDIVFYYLAARYGATVLDYPRVDGTSTYTDITQLFGGSYINIISESVNCMEYPDFSAIAPDKRGAFVDTYHSSIKDLFFTVVMGSREENYGTRQGTIVRAIIDLGVEKFFEDPEIQLRIEKGRQDPRAMPTGLDFYEFLTPEQLKIEGLGDTKEAFDFVRLRLRQFLSSTVGKAVTRPSTLRKDNPLTVYAFTGVSNDEDAAVLSMVALSAAMRNSLRYERSLVFIDEAPILFDFPTVGETIGRLCANGAKAGISVMISAQDPDTIAKSPAASKIFQAMSCLLIGRIRDTAVKSFANYFKIDESLLQRNASRAFQMNRIERYSNWLLEYQGFRSYCRYYPDTLQLALVANNPDEQRARDEVLRSAPNRYEGYRLLRQKFLEKAQPSSKK
ncbi:MAG: hypothetical protein QXU26_04260 [Thermofilaceae archaeon]